MRESLKPGLPHEYLVKLTKALADSGQLIEAGFVGLRMGLPPDLGEGSLDLIRTAYFGGAQHLFASMMVMLEPGSDPTDNDMRRMDSLHTELERWRAEMIVRSAREKGGGH